MLRMLCFILFLVTTVSAQAAPAAMRPAPAAMRPAPISENYVNRAVQRLPTYHAYETKMRPLLDQIRANPSAFTAASMRSQLGKLPSNQQRDLYAVVAHDIGADHPDYGMMKYDFLLLRYGIHVLSVKEQLEALGGPRSDGTQVWTAGFSIAVADFQRGHGLHVDGIPGPDTQAAITEALRVLKTGDRRRAADRSSLPA